MLAIVLAVFLMARSGAGPARTRRGRSPSATLVVANLALIFVNRSWSSLILATLKRPNPALWWVLGGALGFLGLVLYLPLLRALFHFEFLRPAELLVCLGPPF